MTMGLAIVGVGYWGPNLVCTALATPAFRLDWLCDLQVERARAVLGPYTTVRPTDSYDAILSGPGVGDDTNPAAQLAVHDRGVDTLDLSSVPQDRRRQALISYRTGDTLIPALPEREALPSVMAEFSAVISENRPPRTDARAGLRVLKLLEAASRSVGSGGIRISLNGVVE
jgi:predicted dehydrogenase